jgi:hypothetical protein
MNIENPLAYSFILQDDVYLLDADKRAIKKNQPQVPEVIVEKETPKPEFRYLGGHKKQYLIITHYADADFIALDHLTALESTLKRLGYGLDDTAIFNLANYPDAQFQQIIDFFKPQKMLIMGNYAMPPTMGAVNRNKPQPTGNINIRTLFTFSFKEMMDNSENKKEFWEAMKLF